jgi:hypothetical protein
MNDKKWIITGLVVFLIIVLFPFWYNRGKAVPPPEIKLTDKAKAAKECVLAKEYMKADLHQPQGQRVRHEPFQHMPGLPFQQGGLLR